MMLKGLPYSGKTEWAMQWVSEAPLHRLRLSWREAMTMAGGGRTNRYHRLVAFEGCVHMALQALSLGMDVVIDEENLEGVEWTPFTARAAQVRARVSWHNMQAVAADCKKRAARFLPPEELARAAADIDHKADVFRLWLKK